MFQIDSMSRKPVYEQLIEQVESFLLNDVLKPGDQIPSVRNITMQHEKAILFVRRRNKF